MPLRNGWSVRSFSTIWADHHVPFKGYASTYASKLPTCFYMGQMNYVLRVPLWFGAIMALRETVHRPLFLPGAAMFGGHLWAMILFKQRIPKETSSWRNHCEYLKLVVSKARRLCRTIAPACRQGKEH